MSRRPSPQSCPQVRRRDLSKNSHSLSTLWATLPLDSQYGRCPYGLHCVAHKHEISTVSTEVRDKLER
jgi:hypothetical protein